MNGGHWVDVKKRNPEKSGEYQVIRRVGFGRSKVTNIETCIFDRHAAPWIGPNVQMEDWKNRQGKIISTVLSWWEEESC